jgi:hypothetical protein
MHNVWLHTAKVWYCKRHSIFLRCGQRHTLEEYLLSVLMMPAYQQLAHHQHIATVMAKRQIERHTVFSGQSVSPHSPSHPVARILPALPRICSYLTCIPKSQFKPLTTFLLHRGWLPGGKCELGLCALHAAAPHSHILMATTAALFATHALQQARIIYSSTVG